MLHSTFTPAEVERRVVFDEGGAKLVAKGREFPANKISFTSGIRKKFLTRYLATAYLKLEVDFVIQMTN